MIGTADGHAQVGAFAISQTFPPHDTGWRTFPQHYLLYASAGTAQLEIATAQWWLPPQRAAWIAADVPIRIRIQAPIVAASVLFCPGFIQQPAFDCRVCTVSALAREMLLYTMQWGPGRPQPDAAADRFFLAPAAVCDELAARPDHFWLPRAQSPELARALEYTLEHLADRPSFAETAWTVGVSERTLHAASRRRRT